MTPLGSSVIPSGSGGNSTSFVRYFSTFSARRNMA